MEHQDDDTLSTRDIAGGAPATEKQPDEAARFERERTATSDPAAGTEAGTPAAPDVPATSGVAASGGDAGATTADPAASDPTGQTMREPAGAQQTGGGAETAAGEPSRPAMAQGADTDMGALLPQAEQDGFMSRWEEIQILFVDDPRQAVETADTLVANVMQQLADGFAAERERLEGMWGRGEDVGTEDLRVALQRYRTFFHRLLAA
jgi:hypothetical protein